MKNVFIACSLAFLALAAILINACMGPLMFADATPADAQLILAGLAVWCAIGSGLMLAASREQATRGA